jgi:DNA-binding transcriptional regulator YiaG
MSTFAQTIKDEIRRISRREIGLALSKFRRDHIALKKRIAEQKSRISGIEKANKELSKKQAEYGQAQRVEAGSEPEAKHVAVYARGIKSLRRRLGLSQIDLATLVGMKRISISHWEKKSGKLTIIKPEVKKMLTELKGIKKAEVAARLETANRPGKKVRKDLPAPTRKRSPVLSSQHNRLLENKGEVKKRGRAVNR